GPPDNRLPGVSHGLSSSDRPASERGLFPEFGRRRTERDDSMDVLTGEDGLRGRLLAPTMPNAEDALVPVELESGHRVSIPARLLQRRPEGDYYVPLRPGDISEQGFPTETQHQQRETAL